MDKPIPEGVLLPCPMCGGDAALNTCRTTESEFIRLNGRDTGHGVNCVNCGLNNRGFAYGYATPAEAITAWNRRTLTAAQQQGQAVACKHEHKHAEYDCVVCDDCGAIHTDSGKGWPVKNAWFASRALAQQPADVDEAYRRGFVDGAKWWEWEKTGATMWQSDQQRAYDKATEKLATQHQEPTT